MAERVGSSERDDEPKTPTRNGGNVVQSPTSTAGDEDEEEEEEEEEPRLKYAHLTKTVSQLYRGGDGASAFLAAGDKMVVGTLNGNIHVFSLPQCQSLKNYHAHSANVTAVSMSPFPPPLPVGKSEAVNKLIRGSSTFSVRSPSAAATNSPKGSPQHSTVPVTPSNSIHIATSSLDGKVCVWSLIDAADVQMRNFGRPVNAVALSPDYKNDRRYMSGGKAGDLILTTGGQRGKSANATTTGAAAAASGWLGSIGLGADTGTDKKLHGGEGVISTIKWSLSGKYIIWTNEHGMWFMRSDQHLDNADAAFEWKRMSHVGKPPRPEWEDMAGVWKARVEWIDRENVEIDDAEPPPVPEPTPSSGSGADELKPPQRKQKVEEVLVGWGDTVWLIKVHPGGVGTGKEGGERKIGRVEVATILRTDCIVCGVSLYTQNLLLVLAYTESDQKSAEPADTPRKGRHRMNALEPELRLIDVNTREEVSSDTLTVGRYSSLSASDYHLGVIPPMSVPALLSPKGTLSAIGTGMAYGAQGVVYGTEAVLQGTWDATMYAPRMLMNTTRLFSSGDSVRTGNSSDDKTSALASGGIISSWMPGMGPKLKEEREVAATQGMKIFIQSPFDCIVAIKRDLTDRLQWLVKMERYQQAWELLDQFPSAAGVALSEPSEASSPPTPSKASSTTTGPLSQPQATTSLADFFADSASVSSSQKKKKPDKNSTAEKEKRRIGELWLQQLISKKNWKIAGEVTAKVLNTTTRWEHWVWVFIKNKRFDEITGSIPTFQISPPLPPLIYEMVLGHYVSEDRRRFQQLIDAWPTDLFDIANISATVEDQLDPETTARDSTDWQVLTECLAKLYLAEGRHADAMKCYIRLQDADTALTMIKDFHLMDAIADDVPGLVLLRIAKQQLSSPSPTELEDLSSDPIRLLVDEATHGVVPPDIVMRQLDELQYRIFQYFYLKALWRGEGSFHEDTVGPKVGHSAAAKNLAADEGKIVVEDFADQAVVLFADHDRELLMEFLQSSTAYAFDKATRECESRHFVPELVYLLSKTGQMKKALFLIIDELRDVVKAINFAKEQDDQDLWDDLLEYSMSRPAFISGLLAEVGTSINPIKLVRRIPSGLEIEGLREGLKKMIREYDLQDSISSGVAKVLQSEVAVGMETLRKGRERGIKFDVAKKSKKPKLSRKTTAIEKEQGEVVPELAAEAENAAPLNPDADQYLPNFEIKPGICASCGQDFNQESEATGLHSSNYKLGTC